MSLYHRERRVARQCSFWLQYKVQVGREKGFRKWELRHHPHPWVAERPLYWKEITDQRD